MNTNNLEEKDGVYSFTQKIIQEIVKEQDEHTMLAIEEYVKNRQHQGECIAARIIPEGQMRHVVNLGLTIFANQTEQKITPTELFPQEEYIEYLRRLIIRMQNTIREQNTEIHNLNEQIEDLKSII